MSHEFLIRSLCSRRLLEKNVDLFFRAVAGHVVGLSRSMATTVVSLREVGAAKKLERRNECGVGGAHRRVSTHPLFLMSSEFQSHRCGTHCLVPWPDIEVAIAV